MTETVDSDKRERERVCVSVCVRVGGIFYSPSPIFLFPYLIPLSFIGRGVERVMAVAGEKEQKNPKSKHSIIGLQ